MTKLAHSFSDSNPFLYLINVENFKFHYYRNAIYWVEGSVHFFNKFLKIILRKLSISSQLSDMHKVFLSSLLATSAVPKHVSH